MPVVIDDWGFRGESPMRRRKQKQKRNVLDSERLRERGVVPPKKVRGYPLRKIQFEFNSRTGVDIGDF
jgi:hypothetical protein